MNFRQGWHTAPYTECDTLPSLLLYTLGPTDSIITLVLNLVMNAKLNLASYHFQNRIDRTYGLQSLVHKVDVIWGAKKVNVGSKTIKIIGMQ